MILLILILVTLVLWTAQFRFRRRRMYKLASMVPHSKYHLPVVGVAHKLSGSTEDIMTYMKEFSYEAIKTDNGVIVCWLNHLLYYVMVNPLDLETIAKTYLEKDDVVRFPRQFLGNGSLFATVPIWRRRRKILNPTFNTKITESFVKTFLKHSELAAKNLANMCGSEQVDLRPILTAYSVDAVSESVTGETINSQMDLNSPFLKYLKNSLNLACERMFHLWQHPESLYKLMPQYREQQKYIQFINDHLDERIREKVDDFKNRKEAQLEAYYEESINMKGKTYLDVLIHLTAREKEYSNVELREETLTILVAGAETTAVSLEFTLILLAKYPEIQEKVYEEMEEILGDSNRPLMREDFSKLNYLERVVKESLRLFPPAPFFLRKIESEIKLPSGLTLPSGSGLAASILGVHRDPKYWGPDAEHFDPDRFLPERYNLQHACSYMPFSFGPRNCVGIQYAMLSMKTFLATILRRYKIIGEPETGPIPTIRTMLHITMQPVEGCRVKLEKRKSSSLEPLSGS